MNFEKALKSIVELLDNGILVNGCNNIRKMDGLDFFDILTANNIYVTCFDYSKESILKNKNNIMQFRQYIDKKYKAKEINKNVIEIINNLIDKCFGKRADGMIIESKSTSNRFVMDTYTVNNVEIVNEVKKTAENYVIGKGYPNTYALKLHALRRLINNDLYDITEQVIIKEEQAIQEIYLLLNNGVISLDGSLRQFDSLDFFNVLKKHDIDYNNSLEVKTLIDTINQSNKFDQNTKITIRKLFAKLLETKSYLNANNYDSIIKFSEYVSADSSINGRKITVEEKQLVWDYLNKKGYPANKRRLLKDTLNRYINNDITDIDFVIEENKSLKLSK